MKQFGIRMDGCEVGIETLLKETINNSVGDFNYLEIGVAECKTLLAATQIILENKENKNFNIIGLDLPNCGYVIDNLKHISTNFEKTCRFSLIFDSPITQSNGVSLILNNNPRQEIIPNLGYEFDFVIVDACHGRKCVMEDFLAIENKTKKGGVVLFHDTGIEEQGTDWQSHCHENINVRQALIDLGLWNQERVGWKVLKHINGTRTTGGDGNSCAAFIKQ